MTTKTRLLALTAALALTAGAAPSAWALQTEWVATGTVSSGGYDNGGFFGSAGGDLTGDSFTADFYIDTSKGFMDGAPGSYEQSYGGSAEISTSPVYATVTINGITQALSGSYDSNANVFGGGYGSGDVDATVTDNNAYQYSCCDEISIEVSNRNIDGFPTAFGQEFSVSADYGFDESGSINIYNSVTGYYTTVSLQTDNISSPGIVTFASAAPEPAAWTLLIAGVGVAGAALRLGRRRGWAVAA